MKINDFSGGLATRLDPTLLGSNEAIEFTNIDNSKGILASVKNYRSLSTAIERWFYKFNSNFYSSTVAREYVEYKRKLYFTQLEDRAKKVVNNVVKDLGIAAPTAKLTTVINNTGSVATTSTVVQYMYTYYDSSEGVESAPSPISDELTLATGKSIDISDFITTINPYADLIRLYRIGADATDFTLIAELPFDTLTYNDNIPTLNAIGTILDTYNNQMPPTGLRYIIEAYGILFAALGNTLYYSEIGKPDSFPPTNTVQIPKDITGLVAIPDGILIFTRTNSQLLVGTNPDTFRLLVGNPEHGCTNHNSIKVVKNTLLWESVDGICALQGSSITVLTKEKLGKITLTSINAIIYSEQYMLTLTDGSVIILDFRFGTMAIKYLNYIDKDISSLGVFDNILYGVIENNLVIIDDENPIDFYYTSPTLTEGDASQTKLYNNIYVRADGEFTFEVYIDDRKVNTYILNGNTIHDLKIPQEKQRGSSIQFKIQGTGLIKEIEYKVLGRDNGR